MNELIRKFLRFHGVIEHEYFSKHHINMSDLPTGCGILIMPPENAVDIIVAYRSEIGLRVSRIRVNDDSDTQLINDIYGRSYSSFEQYFKDNNLIQMTLSRNSTFNNPLLSNENNFIPLYNKETFTSDITELLTKREKKNKEILQHLCKLLEQSEISNLSSLYNALNMNTESNKITLSSRENLADMEVPNKDIVMQKVVLQQGYPAKEGIPTQQGYPPM